METINMETKKIRVRKIRLNILIFQNYSLIINVFSEFNTEVKNMCRV